ncbi:M1 family metallopeptidase [Pinibacter aurantiacus]|uniref:M1 family metallopeptidase n=1 Tax=Pinibacter aurantiacus TaxID=2851599 RepID=A0A9E2W7C9_9BACT|nr:M1 family metallopeptidase [Pinibacter aurantiacus]MBV4356431.1 M1 family metallopeptidase [Pinibacter aurantiacus]
MKKSLAIFLLLSNNLFAQHEKIDVQQYQFELNVNDTTDIIRGKATIRFKALQQCDNVSFDLVVFDQKSGKGMTVTSVEESNKTLKFQSQENNITVNFSNRVEAGAEKTIAITYQGVPADGLIIARNKFGHRTIFADNWPNRARYWIPCNDTPADKAAVSFTVIAPDHYQVISNGLVKEETNLPNHLKLTQYEETVELPTKVMVIGLADFAVQHSGDVNCVPVYSWIYPEDRTKGFYDYAVAKDILTWFITNVGPYSYKKLANVQSTTRFGGMENASAIFYGEGTLTGNGSNEPLLAHEIAHQWFGNTVTEKSFEHLWLSEGFATYFTDLYLEAKYGKAKLDEKLTDERNKAIKFSKRTNAPIINPTSDYVSLLNAFSYQKGAWVLHMLRRKLGDDIFWKAIKEYYSTYRGKNANTDDLRAVFEKVSGTDLKPFFQQWLYTKEHPVLDVSWKYDANKKEIAITVLQQQTKAFDFPLQIKIGSEIKQIDVRDTKTVTTFSCDTRPQAFVLDPEVNLFFEGSSKEVK